MVQFLYFMHDSGQESYNINLVQKDLDDLFLLYLVIVLFDVMLTVIGVD